MLSTLLSGLASYFSKYFIVSSFLPLVGFAFVNAWVAYLIHDPFHAWVRRELFGAPTVTATTFFTTATAVALLIAAYVLSGLGNFLRGLLEGRWPETLRRSFIALEQHRLRVYDRRLEDAVKTRVDLEAARPGWLEELVAARTQGVQAHAARAFDEPGTVEERLAPLRDDRERNVPIPASKLAPAVTELAATLRTRDVDARFKGRALLDEYHAEVVQLIEFSVELATAEHFRHHNERHSNFGAANLAPTRMGNIANTVQSYAVRRYNCNFEMVWSQMQRAVQKDDKAYASLQESKAQLDFLIACCWLTVVSSGVWLVALGGWSPSASWLVGVALAGPVLAYFWYRAAAEHYRSFGDLLMTLLDTFRFDVLRDLRIPVPTDVVEERVLWDNLHQLSRYVGDINFRYRHPPAS
jgi:hypothetical protein